MLPYQGISISQISITGTPLFQKSPKDLLQNIYSNMEKAKQESNLHRISLSMKYFREGKNQEDLQLRKSVFPTDRPDAQLPRSGRPSQKLSVLSGFKCYNRWWSQ
jgi:hypothetical protein